MSKKCFLISSTLPSKLNALIGKFPHQFITKTNSISSIYLYLNITGASRWKNFNFHYYFTSTISFSPLEEVCVSLYQGFQLFVDFLIYFEYKTLALPSLSPLKICHLWDINQTTLSCQWMWSLYTITLGIHLVKST